MVVQGNYPFIVDDSIARLTRGCFPYLRPLYILLVSITFLPDWYSFSYSLTSAAFSSCLMTRYRLVEMALRVQTRCSLDFEGYRSFE